MIIRSASQNCLCIMTVNQWMTFPADWPALSLISAGQDRNLWPDTASSLWGVRVVWWPILAAEPKKWRWTKRKVGIVSVSLGHIYSKSEQQHLVFIWGRKQEMDVSVTVWICCLNRRSNKAEEFSHRTLSNGNIKSERPPHETKKRSKGYHISK